MIDRIASFCLAWSLLSLLAGLMNTPDNFVTITTTLLLAGVMSKPISEILK